MKKAIFTLFVLSGCIPASEQNIEPGYSRVSLKERKFINGYAVTIIEIDSVEYVAWSSGGIYPLVKK